MNGMRGRQVPATQRSPRSSPRSSPFSASRSGAPQVENRPETRLAEALIVVDVQVAFVSGADAVPAAEPLTEAVRGLVTRARAGGALVVHLQNDGPAGAVDEPGTPGWELYLPIQEGLDEVVVRKTELGRLLRGQLGRAHGRGGVCARPTRWWRRSGSGAVRVAWRRHGRPAAARSLLRA
ncbi:isochorismatase family protein [Actinoplanes sp. NBRC 103695]|uniref:isochorismatase family protein n=1 Tax=Actinoplanes sp. NBRC 103695 TaxID=3032202 RepID=UPI00331C656C